MSWDRGDLCHRHALASPRRIAVNPESFRRKTILLTDSGPVAVDRRLPVCRSSSRAIQESSNVATLEASKGASKGRSHLCAVGEFAILSIIANQGSNPGFGGLRASLPAGCRTAALQSYLTPIEEGEWKEE